MSRGLEKQNAQMDFCAFPPISLGIFQVMGISPSFLLRNFVYGVLVTLIPVLVIVIPSIPIVIT